MEKETRKLNGITSITGTKEQWNNIDEAITEILRADETGIVSSIGLYGIYVENGILWKNVGIYAFVGEQKDIPEKLTTSINNICEKYYGLKEGRICVSLEYDDTISDNNYLLHSMNGGVF